MVISRYLSREWVLTSTYVPSRFKYPLKKFEASCEPLKEYPQTRNFFDTSRCRRTFDNVFIVVRDRYETTVLLLSNVMMALDVKFGSFFAITTKPAGFSVSRCIAA